MYKLTVPKIEYNGNEMNWRTMRANTRINILARNYTPKEVSNDEKSGMPFFAKLATESKVQH